MTVISLIRPLMAGILHSFEPDHVTAVSVLASENSINNKRVNFKTVFKASQWAFGHSATLLLFGGAALIFKSMATLVVHNISFYAELAVGPIMIWLGIVAIKRNHAINNMVKDHKKIEAHEHDISNPIHLHGTKGEEIAVNPMNKSFWIGMLHGLAGTGGALTSALVLSSDTLGEAILILVVESLGIIIAMGVYSYVLISVMSRFLERNLSIFKWMNGIAGMASVIIGIVWIYNGVYAL
jgi:cytochrome c biogenesis protein CcdA